MFKIFLLKFILLIIYFKQILSNNEMDISSNIDEIDENIIKQIIEYLNKTKKCLIENKEECINIFFNEMLMFDELVRFKGIYYYCNGNTNNNIKGNIIKDPIKELINSKTRSEAIEKTNKQLWGYIKCIDNFFIEIKENKKELINNIKYKFTKGLFFQQIKNKTKQLEISKIYSKLLKSLMITKPLYIALLINKLIKQNKINILLEIISTQKLEELKLSIKLMSVLYPKNKINFIESKINFEKILKNKGEIIQFLNWRFDQKCLEKPIIEKKTLINQMLNKFKNYGGKNCLENLNIGDYIEILENENKLKEFLIFRLKCSIELLESKNLINEDEEEEENNLIRILILSKGENITEKINLKEKKIIEEIIIKGNFNLNGWNDNVFKYSIKKILNLENVSQTLFYSYFIQNYGINITTFANVLIDVDYEINVQFDQLNNKLIIKSEKLFNSLKNIPGSIILTNLLENIKKIKNFKIIQNLINLSKNDEKIQEKLIQFISSFIKAKHYVLALLLKQIVEREEKQEENISDLFNIKYLIKLDISTEELNKVELIKESFVKIEELLNKVLIKLFNGCNGIIMNKLGYKNSNEFVSMLKGEINKIIADLDLDLSGDSSEYFKAEYIDLRAIPLLSYEGTLIDRLINKMFNYLNKPIKWLGKKALYSKNLTFQKIFKKINLLMEDFDYFIKNRNSPEKFFLPLYHYERKFGAILFEKIKLFWGNFDQIDWNDFQITNKIRTDFAELFDYFLIFGKTIKLQGKNSEEIQNYLNQVREEERVGGNVREKEMEEKNDEKWEDVLNFKYNELNKNLNELIIYIKNMTNLLNKNLFKNSNKKENNEDSLLDIVNNCFPQETKKVFVPNSILLLRKKRDEPDETDYQSESPAEQPQPYYYGSYLFNKKRTLIIFYLIGGSYFFICVSVLSVKFIGGIKCPVPNIRELFNRRQPPPNILPQQQQQQQENNENNQNNQNTQNDIESPPSIELQRIPSIKYTVDGSGQVQQLAVPTPFVSHTRKRRNINELNKNENFKCQRKGINNTCSNIPFGISFHIDDSQNSIFYFTKKGCLNTKEIKNRKKRELIIWVNCGMWIAYGIILVTLIAYIFGLFWII